MKPVRIPSQPNSNELFADFIVAAEPMRAVLDTVEQVAPYPATVLITGESGTGKEMLARIIHLKSPRAEAPFVVVNCGTLPGQLFEDKLFGHDEGAFTGAVKAQPGRFEMADGGTLFLEDVSELSPENQIDFLRVLETGELRRIGSKTTSRVDVRIVAATSVEIADLVSEGRFRQDLYYRLHVIPLHLPPLRERPEAVPHLLDYFLEQYAAFYGKPKIAFSQAAMQVLIRYRWPGNVRELRNVVERVFILNKTGRVEESDLPPECHDQRGGLAGSNLRNLCYTTEHRAILDALERFNGNRDKVADFLGISPRTLRYKMSRYAISFRRGQRRLQGAVAAGGRSSTG